jgi:hypothetical protein
MGKRWLFPARITRNLNVVCAVLRVLTVTQDVPIIATVPMSFHRSTILVHTEILRNRLLNSAGCSCLPCNKDNYGECKMAPQRQKQFKKILFQRNKGFNTINNKTRHLTQSWASSIHPTFLTNIRVTKNSLGAETKDSKLLILRHDYKPVTSTSILTIIPY